MAYSDHTIEGEGGRGGAENAEHRRMYRGLFMGVL